MSGSKWTFYDPALHPVRVCDVVWCRFPEDLLEDIKPGPKARPGLVRQVMQRKGTDELWLSITYGTSKLKTETRPLDLRISNAEDMVAAGLPQATRFDLDACTKLPWAEEFFEIRNLYKTPVVGSLAQRSRVRLQKLLQIRLQHEALGDDFDSED
ncbi:MAG: hypothetical protein WBN97_10620 [Parvibaculum sp.]|jgi:hypothetical protein